MTRIDPDYDAGDRERELERALILHYKNAGNGNGFQKWVLGLMMLLVVAGVTGVVAVEYNVVQRLTTLEVKVDLLLMRR